MPKHIHAPPDDIVRKRYVKPIAVPLGTVQLAEHGRKMAEKEGYPQPEQRRKATK